jgi:hypothetical protein
MTEFFNGLDQMRVKVSNEDCNKIFKYLDTDGDGLISYNEFCELTEERRRNIDPFKTSPQGKAQTERDSFSLNPELAYITNLKIHDLESMNKLHALTSIKNKKKKETKKLITQALDEKTHGKVSFGDGKQLDSIGDVINHQYLKSYLEGQVTRNATNQVKLMN